MDSDSSSSYTSSSGDSEAMKEYVKAMSPTPSPATPKASFDNLFTEAGLESDDETSQPSGASTSGSSEESKDAPAAKRAPSPRPPPGAKLAPPMSAFKSSLGGSDSSSGSSDMSEMAPKHESMAKGFSEFMQDHPESRKEDSSSGSSRSSDTGSRSSGHEGDHSDRRSETRSDSQSSGSGGSSRTPSHPSQSQRSASSRGSSKEDSVSRSSRKDSEKSSRSGESSKTPSESESRRSASSHGSSKEDSVSRSSRNDSEKSSRSHESSKTPSQSESRRSKSSRSGSLRETSMASPSSRSDTDNKSPKSDRSSNSPSRPRSQKSSSSYEVSSDRDNEKSKSSPRSSDSESKGQDSNSRNEPLEESLNQESMTSKPEAVPSVGSKSSSKSGSHGALRAASPKSVRSGGEGSNSFTSARSRSVHSASVSKENSQKDSFASARSKQSEPSSRSSVRSAPKNSSDAHASKQSASSPIEKEMPPKIGAQDNESGLHGKTEASTRTSLSKKESSSVPKSPPDNESGRSSNSRSPEGSKVSKTSLVIEGKDNISPQASASRPSILQRLEARRRALQNQPSARSQGSSLGSKAKEKKPEETEKVEQVSMKESLQVADVQISLSKDLQQRPSSGEKPVQKARDETSKLESQSEDYDPRKNDVDEWKALIKRSAKSSPESKERQQGQIGPPPKLAENVENFRDPNDDDGWMPPALTTYGENKYKPENSDERLLPPAHRATAPTKDPTVTVRKPQDPTENETHLMKKNDALQQSTPTPPVPEIEVRPPPEDESSLGSCAFLFPREAVPDKSQAVKGEQIVTHKLKPTVAGVDYDYYRTWMLCGSKQPPAHQTRSEEVGREDPPGTTTIFKPKRVISDPVSYAHHQESGHAPLITAPIILPESPKKPPSETWAPNRPTYTPLRAKPADEWEAWKQARMHAAREESSETSAKKSTKSDSSSSESTWAPPTTIQGSTFASTRSKGSRSAPVVISWVPPSQASSVDFTGAVKSQPTSSTRARSAYKDPRGKSKASPVVEDVSTSTSSDSTRSSKNASLSGSTSTSGSTSPSRNSSSRKSESKTRPHAQSSPEKQPSRHSGGSSSSDSGTNTSSEDTNALFTSSKENTAVIATQLLSTAHTDSSAPVRVDIEQGTSPKTTVHSAAAKQRFSRPVVCLCIILSILVLGGVATAAVFVLTDKIGGDPTPTPGGAPTPPFPTAAPVQFTGTDELKTLVVTASPGTESDFVNPASAQSLALDWLSKNQFLNTYSDETKLQRFALATIFYSTDGDSWTQNDLWLSDIDECDWYSSENIDEVCGSGGNLDEVDLKSNNLRGKLPWTQLASLASDLLILDLQDNGLSGPIQNVVADLSSLLLFDVRGNEFSGTIPSGLGQLIDARQLDLSQNRLTGRIPSELSSMTSLESLWLNDNFLSGDIPSELGRLSSLRNMYLVSARDAAW